MTDDDWAAEQNQGQMEGPEEEYEEIPEGDGRARDPGPVKQVFALLYCLVALTFVFFHGAPRGLAPNLRLFVWFAINFVVLFCIPAVIISRFWQERLARYGLQWGDAKTWVWYFVVYFLVMLLVIAVVSRRPAFQTYYPRLDAARESWGWFVFGAMGWLLYFFAWEWFFRGFLLFSLARRTGAGLAILIQTIPFVMMHITKLETEAWASIIAGIALGLMAFRGRSCISTFLLHWAVTVVLDLSIVLWPVG